MSKMSPRWSWGGIRRWAARGGTRVWRMWVEMERGCPVGGIGPSYTGTGGDSFSNRASGDAIAARQGGAEEGHAAKVSGLSAPGQMRVAVAFEIDASS